MLKEKEKDLLMSVILGDGSVYYNKNSNNYSIYIGHGEKQKDYLEWKTNIINEKKIYKKDLIIKSKIIKLNNKEYLQYYIQKTDSTYNKEIYSYYYNDNKEINIDGILNCIKSDRSLAIWFMDDGSVVKQIFKKRIDKEGNPYIAPPYLKLCTHCFSYEDNLTILNWFKKRYNIEGRINSETKRNRVGQPKYYYLNFKSTDSKKIYNIIKPYITQIPSMIEKFKYLIEYNNK